MLYDESGGRWEVEKEIIQIQSNVRCVRRASWLMVILVALISAGLGYGMVLTDNFPYNAPQFVVNLVFALGVASLICLVVFVGLELFYRWRLDQQREECRQLITRLLESRLGKPVTAYSRNLRDKFAGNEDGSAVRVATKPIYLR
jgi:hypothetical protein